MPVDSRITNAGPEHRACSMDGGPQGQEMPTVSLVALVKVGQCRPFHGSLRGASRLVSRMATLSSGIDNDNCHGGPQDEELLTVSRMVALTAVKKCCLTDGNLLGKKIDHCVVTARDNEMLGRTVHVPLRRKTCQSNSAPNLACTKRF